MRTVRKRYDPSRDFGRVRDFLADTFALYGGPFNWPLDRWNFCRYFVIPIHTFQNSRRFGVPTQEGAGGRDELPFWEKAVFVWEDEAGDIVAVLHTENEEPGEAWLQIHPDWTALYGEMVACAEEHLADRADGLGYVKLYVQDGSELERVARAGGYRKLDCRLRYLEYRIGDIPPPQLPEGSTIRSVADEDDVEKRRVLRGLAFGDRRAPSQWPPASAFRTMQQAPDYRADLDLLAVAPSGEYAAFATLWLDQANRYGNFEPVGTHVDYRGRGLGGALLLEGLRRIAALGATRSFMASDNPFYRKVGFVETEWSYSPWIKYFEV